MTTYYVVPTGTNGDGSKGSPWVGIDNIDWDFIEPNETIVLDGTFAEEMTVSGGGADGSPVIVRGGVVDGEGTRTHGIDIDDDISDLTFSGVTVKAARRRGIEATATSIDVARRLRLEDVVVDDVNDTAGLQVGISVNGADIALSNVTVTNTGGDNISSPQYAKRISYVSMYCKDPGRNQNGDNIQVPTGDGEYATVRYSYLHNDADNKQCVIFELDGVGGRGECTDNHCVMVPYSTNGGAALRINGDGHILRNFCEGGAAGPQTLDENGYANARVVGNVCVRQGVAGMEAGNNAVAAVLAQNTLYDCANDGAFGGANESTIEFYNNICAANGGSGLKIAGNNVENYNCSHGNAEYAVETSLGAERTPGANTITADPKFINPEAGDFRLDGDSPCIRAGVKWWSSGENQPQGQDGLRFPLSADDQPDMGAYAVRVDSGYARKTQAMKVGVLSGGVDIVKARRI